MENMIKKIVDADNEAKAMEKDTLEEKEELSKTIEAETKKIYDDFMAKAEEVVKRNDIQETKKAEQQWEEIQSKHNSVHIKLDSDFKLNCDKWVDEIVKRTVHSNIPFTVYKEVYADNVKNFVCSSDKSKVKVRQQTYRKGLPEFACMPERRRDYVVS